MLNKEILKNGRDLLLKLHKVFVDLERSAYESIHGVLTPGQFLNVLIENEDLSWLRKMSMLIVDIDEMFDAKDGISETDVDANLAKLRSLVHLSDVDEIFAAKYEHCLTKSPEAVELQGRLLEVLAVN